MTLRAVYCDLDGTLLGPGGSLFAAPGGGTTLLGARAVEACHRAAVEFVITTGRRQESAYANSRILGWPSYIFEMGAAFVLDGEEQWLTGEWVPRDGKTIHDLITDSGAPALLRDRYAGRLEPHSPWDENRTVSHLLRGDLDTDEANALLAEHDIEGLRLVDNGGIHHPADTRLQVERMRIYHLMPAGASKAAAVAAHGRARGYAREDTIAIGDSVEDLAMAAEVGAYWAVANSALDGRPMPENARFCEAENGDGVYEAVVSTLSGAA